MSVTFTASTLGPTASSFTLTSSSGVTASGASSPLTLQEAVEGTYTYTVSGVNANGTGPSSAASNSVVVVSVDPGAYYPLATVTVPSAGAATISFNSIPQTYKNLQIRGIGRDVSGGESAIFASFNGTGGNGHALYGNGTILGSYQETQGMAIALTPTSGSNSSIFGAGVADILDYSNTNKFKTIRALSGAEKDIAGGNAYIFVQSSLWQSTNAITSISLRINNGANFVQYSSFTLYGIKG
jgi:hypothetical protein